MQSSILDMELQRTLDELCADLFATPALDDCNAILQSLALLAEAFPQAQTLLGRLLSQNDDNQPRYVTTSKLSSLSTNFLYKKETARSTASLVAALANSNVRNQRRIVQSTTGVKLNINHNRRESTNQNESPSTNSAELTAEQVILFTGTSEVKACVVAQINELPGSDDGSPVRPVYGTDEFSAAFCNLDEQHGQLVPCESLANGIGSEGSDLTETVRELLLDMLSFCDSSDQIPLAASNFCRGYSQEDIPFLEPECIQTSPLHVMNARIIMTANLSDQVLQIDCMVNNTEDNLPGSFSARIAQQELVSADNGRLGLLYLSDEALESLLQRCRICTCDNEAHEESDAVYLRLSTREDRGQVCDASDTSDEISQHALQDSIKKSYASTRIPLSGLSTVAKRDLARLNILVLEEKYLGLASVDLTTMTKELAKVVADCNERISYLALARDKELVRSVPEVHRSAAISRCRHCRDLLIQLGKKLALQVKGLDASVSISQEKLSRVTKVVRSSIHDVLAQSETFDPWETPNARVEKLNLDRRLWASGFPAAAYFHDTDKRQRENRKKQQQLSRQLLLQQKKKRSKDEARSKQHRG
ncbi:hypothetical protein PR003_g19024 [Phytophthora rubi]|uniref:Uncharacterized protein n=1 Tax=Phytophthora rubi TaxID=129364 RepID=A0A6A4E103_9STRA|nr:hypothetical protein PR001_g19160 [Phytophthora rubi]KAE9315301.1 hypothetical protein PR003_g19024 [Phytophthora rubi]